MIKKSLILSIQVLMVAFAAVLFSSCGQASKKLSEKIDELTKKSETLDSLINTKIKEAIPLDSLVKTEQEKISQIDSLIPKPLKNLYNLSM